jgi:hypothetical protein
MTGTQGNLGSTVVGLRLHGEDAGERGLGEPEGLWANRGVSRVAGEEAELIEATGATETQRRLQSERRTTVSGGGAPWARAERERGRGCSAEGATEWGRVSECGRAPEKARAHGAMAGKRAVVGVSTAEGACGSEGGRF